jgi:hypothetical protein
MNCGAEAGAAAERQRDAHEQREVSGSGLMDWMLGMTVEGVKPLGRVMAPARVMALS